MRGTVVVRHLSVAAWVLAAPAGCGGTHEDGPDTVVAVADTVDVDASLDDAATDAVADAADPLDVMELPEPIADVAVDEGGLDGADADAGDTMDCADNPCLGDPGWDGCPCTADGTCDSGHCDPMLDGQYCFPIEPCGYDPMAIPKLVLHSCGYVEFKCPYCTAEACDSGLCVDTPEGPQCAKVLRPGLRGGLQVRGDQSPRLRRRHRERMRPEVRKGVHPLQRQRGVRGSRQQRRAVRGPRQRGRLLRDRVRGKRRLPDRLRVQGVQGRGGRDQQAVRREGRRRLRVRRVGQGHGVVDEVLRGLRQHEVRGHADLPCGRPSRRSSRRWSEPVPRPRARRRGLRRKGQ